VLESTFTLRFGSEGWGFESLQARQKIQQLTLSKSVAPPLKLFPHFVSKVVAALASSVTVFL
jgi:hypothetical protein